MAGSIIIATAARLGRAGYSPGGGCSRKKGYAVTLFGLFVVAGVKGLLKIKREDF